MYVDVSTVRQGARSYTRFLLRESFRENGQVKHRTIANLSHGSPQEIEAIRLAPVVARDCVRNTRRASCPR